MVRRRGSASSIASLSRTTATCTRRGANCCAASVERKKPATPTAVRWRWSTTTPSGACSSGGWRSSAPLPAAQGDFGSLGQHEYRVDRGRAVSLEVPGRRTGRVISFPVVIAGHEGERYLVAMLGEGANWVRNVRAAGGRAVLRHGRREAVRLDENEVGARAPILRRYLADAPVSDPGSLYCTGSR